MVKISINNIEGFSCGTYQVFSVYSNELKYLLDVAYLLSLFIFEGAVFQGSTQLN